MNRYRVCPHFSVLFQSHKLEARLGMGHGGETDCGYIQYTDIDTILSSLMR